jgi:hypothetical protein
MRMILRMRVMKLTGMFTGRGRFRAQQICDADQLIGPCQSHQYFLCILTC